MRLSTTINYLLKRKIATVVLITASIAASATLGDDGGKKAGKTSGMTVERSVSSRSFSLRSNYSNFKGANLFRQEEKKFIMLNTVVSYQKGNTTYVQPLKKRVILDKIKFNPAPSRF